MIDPEIIRQIREDEARQRERQTRTNVVNSPVQVNVNVSVPSEKKKSDDFYGVSWTALGIIVSNQVLWATLIIGSYIKFTGDVQRGMLWAFAAFFLIVVSMGVAFLWWKLYWWMWALSSTIVTLVIVWLIATGAQVWAIPR